MKSAASAGAAPAAGEPIPIAIRLAVIGHRVLANPAGIRKSVEGILAELDDRLSATPHYFDIASALAEGADRIVAGAVLSWRRSTEDAPHRLSAVLPLPQAEYLQDFQAEASRAEVRAFCAKAVTVEEMPSIPSGASGSRPLAYRRCAEALVDRCEILIAVWDGQPGRGAGGTAGTVSYARRTGRSMYWIHPETGAVTLEDPHRQLKQSLGQLDEYHRERLPNFVAEVKKEGDEVERRAATHDALKGVLAPLPQRFLRQFVRVDRLALRYQKRYQRAVMTVYAMAAVVAATVAVLTVTAAPATWFWLEVAEIASVVLTVWIADHGDWHRKWIDYRFLAERFRGALFLAAANVHSQPLQTPAYFRLSHRPDSWMVGVFNAAWERPPLPTAVSTPPERLRDFLATEWIGRQVEFYFKSSARNRSRFHRLDKLGEVLLYVALLAGAVHATSLLEEHTFLLSAPHWLGIAAVVIPAVAATLAGIRVHGEYYRNSVKYEEMALHLEAIRYRVAEASDRGEFVREIETANHIMLRENQDWRATFYLQELRG